MNKQIALGIVFGLCIFQPMVLKANSEEGRAFAKQLHDRGYPDQSAEINSLEQEVSRKQGNQQLRSQTHELGATFDTHFDSGKKDEHLLKSYFGGKNLEVAKHKNRELPTLGDSELLLKQKHRFQISTEDPLFKKHQEISESEISKTEGLFQKGQLPKQANIQLKDKILRCRKGSVGEKKECVKRRVLRLVDGPEIAKTISVSASGATMHTVYLTVDLIQGISSFSTNTPWKMVGYPLLPLNGKEPFGSASVAPLLTVNTSNPIKVSFSGISNQSEARATYTVLQEPSVQNNFVAKISFHFNAFWEAEGFILHPMSATYTWVITETPKKLEEIWEGCEDLEREQQENNCECVSSEPEGINETKTIAGFPEPITRTHWSEYKVFLCGEGREIDECEALIEQKCEQVDSKCAVLKNNRCIEHENTFRCGVPDYLKTDALSFHEGELSFLSQKGQAATEAYAPEDFIEALTNFSALTEMGKEMQDSLGGILGDPNNPRVFHGQCRQCRVNLGSFARDCCKLKGVLQGLLGKCNEEEKKLAVAALKNKRCVKVGGRYCHKKKVKICVEKRDSYCCYGSQLARILQEIAHQQLGISWGEAKNPNCGSLSAEQLSRLDFDTPYAKQKLSEILSEIQASAEEKFHRVQQAVAAAKNLQVKAKEWEQKQAQIEKETQSRVKESQRTVMQGTSQ